MLSSKKRSSYLQNFKHRSEFSTADKFDQLEETHKKYEELIEENIWLRQQLGNKSAHKPSLSSFKQGKIMKNRSENQTLLWDSLQRNKFLEQKVTRIQKQKKKQSKTIEKIKNSQKWQNRNRKEELYYQKRYIKLLRVTSPYFLN